MASLLKMRRFTWFLVEVAIETIKSRPGRINSAMQPLEDGNVAQTDWLQGYWHRSCMSVIGRVLEL